MSLLPHDIHPTCNRPDCHRSPFDWWFKPTDCPALRSGFGNFGGYSRPLFTALNKPKLLFQEAKIGKDGFQVCLDVQHFQPNEISVKTENNFVVVHAKHEDKQDDHGYIQREFTRRYQLPEGFKPENVTSTLSSDGILMIKTPHSTPAVEGNVRYIQIQQTGPAHLNVTTNEGKEKIQEEQTELNP